MRSTFSGNIRLQPGLKHSHGIPCRKVKLSPISDVVRTFWLGGGEGEGRGEGVQG